MSILDAPVVPIPGHLKSHKDRTLEEIILDVLRSGGGIAFRKDERDRTVRVTVAAGALSARTYAKVQEYIVPGIEMDAAIVGPGAVLARAANECERGVYG